MRKKRLFLSTATAVFLSTTFVMSAKAGLCNCGTNCCWELKNGVLNVYTKDKTTAGSMDYTTTTPPWYGKRGSIKSVTIEGADETTNTKGIQSIGSYAFSGTWVSAVTIPSSVTSIGDSAFYYATALTSITIPDSVTSIGNYAFKEAQNLTNITIPDSVTSLGNSAFSYDYKLENVTLSNNLTSIGDYVFSNNTGLTSITIPDSVTSIGEEAFYYANHLTSITLSDNLVSIGKNALANLPYAAVIYCQEGNGQHGGKTCEDVIDTSNTKFRGTLQLYTKDSDGNMILYNKNGDGTITSNGVTYDSVDAMMATLFPPAEPESVATPEPSSGTQTGTSDTSGLFGTAERGKRIYTVKEANEAAGRKNKLMIRYK